MIILYKSVLFNVYYNQIKITLKKKIELTWILNLLNAKK